MAQSRFGRTGRYDPDQEYQYEENERYGGNSRASSDRFGSTGDYSGRFSPVPGDPGDDYDQGYEDDYEGGYEDEDYPEDYDEGYAGEYEDEGYGDDPYDDEYDDYAGNDYGNRRRPLNLWDRIVDLAYDSDLLTYALLFLFPPLGIFLLWRRGRFERTIRLAISAASAVWFVIFILLVATLSSSGRTDRQVGSALPTPTPGLVALQAEVTRAPTEQPASLASQPTATAVSGQLVATAAPGSLVWISPEGTYYHDKEDCQRVSSDETVSRVTLENALNRGKYACPTCYDLQVFYTTPEAVYYHSDPTCSGMTGGVEATEDQAKAQGKQACPVCVTRVTDVLMKVVEGSTKLVDISTVDESGMQVWFTENGVNYHTNSTCRGMTGARQASLKEALLAGKTACSTCCASAANIVYCTRTGTYYHADPTCSGMTGASDVTLAEALVLGKQECPVCTPSSAELAVATPGPAATDAAVDGSEPYVYATSKGKYYHINSDCSGMKNAKRVTLRSMLAEGRPACPECCKGAEMDVYCTDGGTYYHSYATCSGMSGASKKTQAQAIVDGYKRCPRCWGEAASGFGQ